MICVRTRFSKREDCIHLLGQVSFLNQVRRDDFYRLCDGSLVGPDVDLGGFGSFVRRRDACEFYKTLSIRDIF